MGKIWYTLVVSPPNRYILSAPGEKPGWASRPVPGEESGRDNISVPGEQAGRFTKSAPEPSAQSATGRVSHFCPRPSSPSGGTQRKFCRRSDPVSPLGPPFVGADDFRSKGELSGTHLGGERRAALADCSSRSLTCLRWNRVVSHSSPCRDSLIFSSMVALSWDLQYITRMTTSRPARMTSHLEL